VEYWQKVLKVHNSTIKTKNPAKCKIDKKNPFQQARVISVCGISGFPLFISRLRCPTARVVIVGAEAVVDVEAIVTVVETEGVGHPVMIEVDAVAGIAIALGAEAVIVAAELPPDLLLDRLPAIDLIQRRGIKQRRF
jgi:hypothetical protein